VAKSLTREQRARRYLQASQSAGYTGLPAEQREAYEAQQRSHERAYPRVREHALAGADSDFDRPLRAGEREHQRHLRSQEGLQHSEVLRIRRELRGERAAPRRRSTSSGRGSSGTFAGPRVARAAAGGAAGAVATAAGGGGNIFLYVVGLILGLSLIYLLVSEKGKGPALVTGIVNTIAGGVRAFVAPVDPIAHIETALGASPIASPASTAKQEAVASAASPASTSDTGYVQPWAGGTPERIDMGQDFALQPGAPIRAIGAGKVTGVYPNWWAGQPLVAYELTGGAAKGRTVYVAEQITPAVRAGDVVKAGQVIGTYARSGTGIETGWGASGGRTLAQATTGYVEGQVTAAGKSFSSFLAGLGVRTH
jgi:murein DD-endopeptidase MepM/ murein hydrolase activator NlpD